MNKSIRLAAVALLALLPAFVCGAPPKKASQLKAGKKVVANKGAALGTAEFMPSPERPIGWRGDGSGRYPGATPPVKWERSQASGGYATKGILWMTPLPNAGVSSPIIVGDRIYLTTEPNDLVCLDKNTGKILGIRSAFEFEGMDKEELQSLPDVASKLAPLLPTLTKANDAAVSELNGEAAGAASGQLPPALKQKRDLEKQIIEGEKAIDKKVFERYWAQAVFGFAGQTPTSDGTHVCVFYTTGVSACYDLDGNRKWVHRGKGGGSEHGNFASPLLISNQMVVWANEMRGYDVESGKLLWTNSAKANNSYGSLFRLKCGDDAIACFQSGYFVRVRDGALIWDKNVFGDTVTTPIVEGDTLYARMGYPRTNDEKTGFKAFKIPESTDSGKFTPAYSFTTDWTDEEMVVDKAKNPFDRGYVASPLLVDGLIYRLTQGGGLIVNDAASGEVVYRKVLDLKPRTHYWEWAGCSASPTLAGKYIYLMDNSGATIVIEPGRQYKEVAHNMLAELKDGKDQAQFLATPVFEESRMYYRSPGFLYCIGAK